MSSHDSSGAAEITVLIERLREQLAMIQVDEMPPDAGQQLMTMAVATYAALREAGHDIGPFVHEDAISATEAMVAAANILHAADLGAFELGMWMARGNR